MRKIFSCSVTGRWSSSFSVVKRSSSVSFRNFAARRERRVGAKVSGTVNVMRSQAKPERMSWIQ